MIRESLLHLSTPLVITLLAIASSAIGVGLSSIAVVGPWPRRLVPFAGGLVLGITLFSVVPELALTLGVARAASWLISGTVLLFVIDRWVYPVCPSCSPAHDHDHCATSLHGFAAPLFIAAAIHAAVDGWSAATTGEERLHLGGGIALAIGAHKIPEGLALGIMVRAALRSPANALLYNAAAQSFTLGGAVLEGVLAPYLPQNFLSALLALAGGGFLYLGGHAIHGEWRRRGPMPVFVPALAGLASPSVLRLFRLLP